MVSLILILFAAIFKAIADTLWQHFDTSIFKKMPYKYWNPLESYKYVKFLPLSKFRPDPWHLSNSAMIVCFICAAVFYKEMFAWYYGILCYGGCFNLMFSLFYNTILRRK